MRSIFVITIFAFILGLGLVSAVGQDTAIAPAKPADKIKPAPTPTPDKGKKSEISFPDVDGWERGKKTVYPTPELGYSIPYQSDDGYIVTVYVYNGGNKTIPNDLTGIVKSELEKAKKDILAIEKAGYYTDVKELTNDTTVIGGKNGKVMALRASYTFSARGEKYSEIYIFPYQNNFVKIRATRPIDDQKTHEEALSKLFSEIDALFAQ